MSSGTASTSNGARLDGGELAELATALGRDYAVERELGRDRGAEKQRWQSRLIDLDLLAYDEAVIAETDLEVPHPEMHRRRFVLEPFCEIWPGWRHPTIGLTARELLGQLK